MKRCEETKVKFQNFSSMWPHVKFQLMSSVKRWKTDSQILSDISKTECEIIEKLLGIKTLLSLKVFFLCRQLKIKKEIDEVSFL